MFDTQQLSVVRGSSHLLQEAIGTLAKSFASDLEALSTGASSGLFRVKSGRAAQEIAAAIAECLFDRDRDYWPFTFVVATVEDESQDFLKAQEALKAKVRFEQLRQLTQAPDPLPRPGVAYGVCALEGKRRCDPRAAAATIGGKEMRLSESVRQRWRKGLGLKQDLYIQALKPYLGEEQYATLPLDLSVVANLVKYGFAPDFEALARCEDFRILGDKLAVIYVDGNRFGAIQRQHATACDKQKDFDTYVKTERAKLLLGLLRAFVEGRFAATPLLETKIAKTAQLAPALCFEALLWGGDEITFVVPAWLGFDLISPEA